MKLLITITFASFAFLSAAQKKNFELKGNITGLKGSKLMFAYQEEGKIIRDSTDPENGIFKFTANIKEPTLAGLFTPDRKFITQFYIEKGRMRISKKDSLGELVITGSPTQDGYRRLVKKQEELQQKFGLVERELLELKKTDSAAYEKRWMEEVEKFRTESRLEIIQFIKNHPKNIASAYELMNIAAGIPPDDFQLLYDGFHKSIKKTEIGKKAAAKIEARGNTKIGIAARDFTQKNEKGEDINLASFRGKYVLIDFWASWCIPCRKENPTVVKTYNKYKDRGFEILGVSLDQKDVKWKEAIQKDQLTWIQVSDLKGWGNSVAVQYDVGSIPATFLIDPNGIIIAKNLRGEELEKKLADIFPD